MKESTQMIQRVKWFVSLKRADIPITRAHIWSCDTYGKPTCKSHNSSFIFWILLNYILILSHYSNTILYRLMFFFVQVKLSPATIIIRRVNFYCQAEKRHTGFKWIERLGHVAKPCVFDPVRSISQDDLTVIFNAFPPCEKSCVSFLPHSGFILFNTLVTETCEMNKGPE